VARPAAGQAPRLVARPRFAPHHAPRSQRCAEEARDVRSAPVCAGGAAYSPWFVPPRFCQNLDAKKSSKNCPNRKTSFDTFPRPTVLYRNTTVIAQKKFRKKLSLGNFPGGIRRAGILATEKSPQYGSKPRTTSQSHSPKHRLFNGKGNHAKGARLTIAENWQQGDPRRSSFPVDAQTPQRRRTLSVQQLPIFGGPKTATSNICLNRSAVMQGIAGSLPIAAATRIAKIGRWNVGLSPRANFAK
jgi:hypothetical protein